MAMPVFPDYQSLARGTGEVGRRPLKHCKSTKMNPQYTKNLIKRLVGSWFEPDQSRNRDIIEQSTKEPLFSQWHIATNF
jgi:hypothetical protein